MINSSMVTGRRCVNEEEDKWFVDSLFEDYTGLLYVLSWANFCMLAFGSTFFCIFWGRYRSFRVFSNYIIFNLMCSLTLFNASKITQVVYFDHSTSEDKESALFFIWLSMGWFSSWFFVMCFLSCLKHIAKGVHDLNHKYWKTNLLAVGFALVLAVCPSYLSSGYYPALLALITMPGYAAYLTTTMLIVEVLLTKEKRESTWRMVKSCTYKTCGLFILGTMQLGEYNPKLYNYTWLCMVVLQMFLFVFCFATGDIYNMEMYCQKDQSKPIVSDAKNEVELITVIKDVP